MPGESVNKISSLQQAQKYQPPAQPGDYADDEVIIKFRDGSVFDPDKLETKSPRLNRSFKRHGVHRADRLNRHDKNERKNKKRDEARTKFGLDRMFRLKVSKGSDIRSVISDLRTNPEVEYAEPNYRVKTSAIPNDPSYSLYQWGLPKINAEAAWNINTGSNSVVIAVVDTGVDRTHPDLAANVWTNTGEIAGNGADDDGNGKIDDVYGWNFVGGNNNVLDDASHGTHVAGIAGAAGNNGEGISGLNWQVKLMAVKALDSSGNGSSGNCAQAIMYAADKDADIINNSWGGYYFSQAVKDAVDYAYSSGCFIAASTGNDNVDLPTYPASLEHVAAVGATDQNDQKANFSNYGNYIDLTAPGTGIYSTLPAGAYGNKNGTSMAAPLVSGLAALIRSNMPSYSNDQIYQALISTADDLGAAGWDSFFGYGRINAYNAIRKTNILTSKFLAPSRYSIVSGIVNLIGTSSGNGFDHYDITWGAGEVPTSWSSAGITLAGGGSSPVTNGALASIDTGQITQEGAFTIRMRSYNNIGEIYEDKLVLNKSSFLKAGWPKQLITAVGGTHPTLGDINQDGKDEIAIARGDITEGGMYVLDGSANNVPNWPAPFDLDASVYSSAAMGNFAGDKKLELAAHNFQNRVKVFNSTGSVLPPWPMNLNPYFVASHCVAGDLNNDGMDEIISLCGNQLYVWNGQGYALPGWPVSVNVDETVFPGHHPTPAFADIDKDGFREIILPLNTGELRVFNDDGTENMQWHKTGLGAVDWKCSSPAVADVNGDKQLEVFMAFGHTIYGFKSDGTNLPGWPKTFAGEFQSSLAIGNIAGDSNYEIVAVENGAGDKLHAFDYQGNDVPGFPVSGIYSLLGGPIVADLDGDGSNEIAAVNWFPAKVEIIKGDGKPLNGWPFTAPEGEVFYDAPAVGDVDGDKKLELVVAGWDRLYCFDFPGLYNPAKIPWGMYNRDSKHTACIPLDCELANPMLAGFVNDGLGADIDVQNDPTTLSANWDGFIDPNIGTNTISEYRYAIGTSPFSTDVMNWTSSGLNKNYTQTGLSLLNGVKYYNTIRAYSNMGLYIDGCSDGVVINSIPPAPAYVNDGTGADIDWQLSLAGLAANWAAVPTAVKYWYAIGTTPGATDVLGWIDNASSAAMTVSLPLTQGSTYYNSVRAENMFGIQGPAKASDGIVVGDIFPPHITDFTYGKAALSFTVKDDETAIDPASLAINIIDSSGQNVASYSGVGDPLISFDAASGRVTLQHNLPLGTYTVQISVSDTAGNSASSEFPMVLVFEYTGYNYPNPFSLSKNGTKIHYELPEGGKVTIQIFDRDGYLIKELVGDQMTTAGKHEVEWNGTDRQGKKVPENIYFCVILAKDKSGKQAWKKIVKILVTR